MAEYYTLSTVRDQILQNGWTVQSVYFSGDHHAADLVQDFPSNWEYCPCNISALCAQRNTKACIVRIGISTDSPNTGTPLFIEIIYLREGHTGIVRTNQMRLKAYIDAGKINERALRTIAA